MSVVSCDGLESVFTRTGCSAASFGDCIDLLRVLVVLVKSMPIGRIALSSRVGLSERRVRRILGYLRSHGIVGVDRVAGSEVVDDVVSSVLGGVFYENVGDRCVAGMGVDSSIYAWVGERYLFFRDMVVLGLGWPGVLELIGLRSDSGEVFLPGVPSGLEDVVSGILGGVDPVLASRCSGLCVFAVSRLAGCCSLLAASMVYGTASLCGIVGGFGADRCG